MQKTYQMSNGESCDGNCNGCSCGNCGGEMFPKLIRGRLKRDHRRYLRHQDRSVMKKITTTYNWRNQ
jgi:hypothetical protein